MSTYKVAPDYTDEEHCQQAKLRRLRGIGDYPVVSAVKYMISVVGLLKCVRTLSATVQRRRSLICVGAPRSDVNATY